jgi:hypothetical protein
MWYNCYAYAFEDYDLNSHDKPQPGDKHGANMTKYSCENIIINVLSDHPDSQFLGTDPSFNNINIPGYNLLYLCVDIPNNDYHFYKKKNGVWSHKPGLLPIQYVDAKGVRIVNPRLADHNYVYYQYTYPCGFLLARIK